MWSPGGVGGGSDGAVEAAVRLLEADLVRQLVAVGAQLAHLAFGLQGVRSSGDAAAEGFEGGGAGLGGVPAPNWGL